MKWARNELDLVMLSWKLGVPIIAEHSNILIGSEHTHDIADGWSEMLAVAPKVNKLLCRKGP